MFQLNLSNWKTNESGQSEGTAALQLFLNKNRQIEDLDAFEEPRVTRVELKANLNSERLSIKSRRPLCINNY